MARTDEPIFYEATGNLPSVKSLMRIDGCDKRTAQKIRAILLGQVDLMTCHAAQARQAQAYNDHEPLTLALDAVNELLGTHGVEYIATVEDGYAVGSMCGLDYCNTGDTYADTLCHCNDKDRWYVACWGNFVEARENFYV